MSKTQIDSSLVSVQWLHKNLDAENLIVLDASMRPIGLMADQFQETPVYIPGSLRFNFDDVICDRNSPLPHTMPSAADFENEMQKMGIDQDSVVIVYDKTGIVSSPRAWWMFRAMGHDQVAVLDGGLPAWTQAGYDTVSTLSKPRGRGNFASQPQGGLFVDSQAVVHALSDSAFSVIDARSAGRFTGQEPEPRPGLRGGHMPNAINVPYLSLQENGQMLPKSKLQTTLEPYKDKKLIFSCGSGVTAGVDALAAELAGFKNLAVYDGSWSEWGKPDSGLPVVQG